MSSEEETKKIADQNGIELLPLYDKLAKKLDVGSYHSDRSLSSLGSDDIDVGARAGDAKGKRRPRVQLIQAVKVAKHDVIDEWIEYLKVHPEDEWGGKKIIDECDWEEEMNAVHVAVIRNKVQILKKLADAGADLEKCTEDEAASPPLVLAARHLPKVLFEEEIIKEPMPKKDAVAEKRISKVPVCKTKSKADDAPRNGGFRKRAVTAGKDAKPKKERVERIIAEKTAQANLKPLFMFCCNAR